MASLNARSVKDCRYWYLLSKQLRRKVEEGLRGVSGSEGVGVKWNGSARMLGL